MGTAVRRSAGALGVWIALGLLPGAARAEPLEALALDAGVAGVADVASVADVAQPPPAWWREASYAASVAAVSLGSGIGSTWLGTRPQAAHVEAVGRPAPLLTAVGFGFSLALNFAITHLLVPQLTMLGDDERFVGDVRAAREEAWRRARWPLLGSMLGFATSMVGAGLETAEFGRGQTVMLVGMGLMLVATLVADVLEGTGAWAGALESRRPRR